MSDEELLGRLAAGEPETRRRAVERLQELSPAVVGDALRRALGDEDWRVRKEAARAAARIAPRAVALRAALDGLADRDDIGLRNAAVEALVHIGPDAVPGAAEALAHLDADGRKLAVEVLAGAPTLVGMRALASALGDTDPNVVAAAAEALGRAALAGDEALDLAQAALVRALAHPDTAVRGASLDALASLDVEVPFAVLEPFTRDPLLRRSALASLGGHKKLQAFTILAEACGDPSSSVAFEAIASLGRSLERLWEDEATLEHVARVLGAVPGAHARLREAAEATEAATSEAKAGALLALGVVRDPDDVARIAAALDDELAADRAEAALRRFGHDAVAPLVDSGRSAAPPLRGRTLSMLPVLDARDGEALVAVRAALSDASPEVVAPALKSLVLVGGSDDLAPVLGHVGSADARIASAARSTLEVLVERHPEAARRALEASRADEVESVLLRALLAEHGHAEAEDVVTLERALTHADATVRRTAATALGATGTEAAVSAVMLAMADEDDGVAQAALRALGRLGASDTLAGLAASTRDPARLAAVLRALGEADRERALAAARPLLRASAPLVAEAAIDVLASSGGATAAAGLAEAIGHPDLEVVKLALTRLAAIPGDLGTDPLVGSLSHPSPDVRSCAAELLGQRAPSPDVSSVLQARLEREGDAAVRGAVMSALASVSQRLRDERIKAP